jgi:hypothetical protein
MSPLGPPFPGESVEFYDGSEIYWDIVPKEQIEKYPPTVKVTAVNGTQITINRLTGVVIP